MQTPFWARLKEEAGWKPYQVENIWILQKSLPLGKTFLYSPEVTFNNIKSHPEHSEGSPTNASISNKLRDSACLKASATQNDNFLSKIKKIAQNSHTIFFRLEILDEFDDKIIEKLKQIGFIKAFEEVQPEYRQMIDLTKDDEEILAQMKQKGRYNIKIAQKNQVEIIRNDHLDSFYKLFVETSKRDKFSIRSQKYFQDLVNALKPNDIVNVLVATYQNKPVAGAIIVFYEGRATYLYGASANEYRNIMAPYLLHWEAIKIAKQRGCQSYDLGAVSPEDQENHKYVGISRFKRQFGGRTVHLVGSYDLVFKPTWYKLFKMAEKYRRK